MIKLDKASFPESILNLGAGDEFARACRQESQETTRLVLQSNSSPVFAKLARVQIELKSLESNAAGLGLCEDLHVSRLYNTLFIACKFVASTTT